MEKPLNNNKSKHNLYFYSIYECNISFVLLFSMYEEEPNCQIVWFKKQSDGTKNNNWSGINQLDRLKPQPKAREMVIDRYKIERIKWCINKVQHSSYTNKCRLQFAIQNWLMMVMAMATLKCIVNVILRISVGFNIVMTYFRVNRTTDSTTMDANSMFIQQFQCGMERVKRKRAHNTYSFI